MKQNPSHFRLAFLASALTFTPLFVSLAADTNSSPAGTSAAVTTPAPVIAVAPEPAKLPYGAEDVLKLSRAQIGDEIILNYVQSSGTIYNLAPKDIVYLRDQGVSERVINAMLDQRKRVEYAAQAVAPGTGGVPNAAMVANAPSVPNAATAPGAPNYTDPNATYAEAPLTPPASSVYVIPSAPSYAYYGPYDYSYPYYYGGWYGPPVSFGFRFGGHGGFHGGHGSFGGHGSGGHRR